MNDLTSDQNASNPNVAISPEDFGLAVGAARAFLGFLSKGVAMYLAHTAWTTRQPRDLREALTKVDTETARAAEAKYLVAIGTAFGEGTSSPLDMGAQFDLYQNKAFEAVIGPLVNQLGIDKGAQLIHLFVIKDGFDNFFELQWGLCQKLVKNACNREGHPQAWSMSRQAVLDGIPVAVEAGSAAARKAVSL